MKIRAVLEDRIQDELAYLGGIDASSDEYDKVVDGVAKLLDREIELEKIDIEKAHKAETMEDERKSRFISNAISVLGIVVPVAVTIWGTRKSFEFEKEGTITTIMGRGFINKLLPKK